MNDNTTPLKTHTERAPRDVNIYAMNDINTTRELSYYEKNKERCKEQRKNYNDNPANKERLKRYRKKRYQENKERIRSDNREYLKRDYVKQRRKERWKERYNTDPNFKIECILRARLYDALKTKGIYKTQSALSLVGCHISEFKVYIESLWQLGMTWENYSHNTWHIDHIKPCNTFDLTDAEQQKKCFHYSNLRPLMASDNLSRPHNGSDIR